MGFKLRSGNSSGFKMMGSSASPYKEEKENTKPEKTETPKPEKTETPKPETPKTDPAPKPSPQPSDDPSIDPDDPMGGFEPGENLKGSGYEYNTNTGEIVKSDYTDDLDPVTEAIPEESDFTSGTRGHTGNVIQRDYYESDDPENKSDYYIDKYNTRESMNEKQVAGYGVPYGSDQFSDVRPSHTDPDTGEVVFMGTDQQYGDDIAIPYGGVTDSDAASIGVSEATGGDDKWGGKEKLQNYGDGLTEGAIDNIQDTVTGRDKVEGEIIAGDDQGKTMKLVEGRGGNLISKKVIKDGPLGLKREKEVHKKTNKGGVSYNSETGELEYSKGAIVSTRKTINPETGKMEKKKYINGRELTPEYKEQIKQAKKNAKQQKKNNKKASKVKKEHEKRNKALRFNEASGEWEKNPNYEPMV
tara:strand:+ start:3057 stop:4298 length:1242 start_codon:yes stop_codon:yes gene_type:complete